MTDDRNGVAARRSDERARPVAAGQGLDVVALWPELFEGLDDRDRNALRQTCASHWLDGWVPTYGEISDLVGYVRNGSPGMKT